MPGGRMFTPAITPSRRGWCGVSQEIYQNIKPQEQGGAGRRKEEGGGRRKKEGGRRKEEGGGAGRSREEEDGGHNITSPVDLMEAAGLGSMSTESERQRASVSRPEEKRQSKALMMSEVRGQGDGEDELLTCLCIREMMSVTHR
ncbi:unnamed protein product [Pleuronectes platessa]|uniref:Uncharacterized protein n=1 Tax=Pleuronectes platessa TaxID=8262 RepID=A0A9N7VL02_PLEPL|nr:unnamed protein product [Pleuronectes platessa]